MMRLHHQREAAAVETLHHPDLPQRARPVEGLREQVPCQLLQLGVAAGTGERRVAHVVGEVEAGIVHPDGPALHRRERQPLAVARQVPEPGADEGADRLDVDPSVGRAEGPRIEERDGSDVHRVRRPLEEDERGVLDREALERVGHGGPSWGVGWRREQK